MGKSVSDWEKEKREVTWYPSWRSILIGLLLIPLFDYWVLDMEVRTSAVEPTDLTLVAPAVVVLAFLVGVNSLLLGRWSHWALKPGELLTIFSILVLGVALSSMNAMPVLVYLISYGRNYATPENGWAEKLLPYFPKSLVVDNEKIVKDWYRGYGTLYDLPTFLAWAKPLGLWMIFVACFILSAYCINALLWRHWSKHERLTFPVIQLPLAMVTPGEHNLFRQKLFWLAFLLAGTINMLNGLNFLYPSVPGIQTRFFLDLGQMLVGKPPWSAIGWTPINLYPFVIGLGFMMPLDLLFSFVFFYWVWKVERIIGAALGLNVNYSALLGSGYPHYRQQMMGVWIAILIGTLLSARKHLTHALQIALGPRDQDQEEPIPYRWAFVGILVGLIGAIGFLRWAGLSTPLAIAFVLVLFGMYVAIARIRCELGPPCQDLPASGPDVLVSTLYTPQALGFKNCAGMTLLFFVNAEHYRTAPSGTQMETLQMADLHRQANRRFFCAMYFATLLGAVVGLWGALHMGYKFGGHGGLRGAPEWYAWQAYTRMNAWINNPVSLPGPGAIVGGVIAFLGSILLIELRKRFFGFPLNPIAYAVTGYWTGDHFWFPLLIAYICKGITLRYAGLKGYRQALPFFQGLILGEFTVGMVWQGVALILKSNVYTYWR